MYVVPVPFFFVVADCLEKGFGLAFLSIKLATIETGNDISPPRSAPTPKSFYSQSMLEEFSSSFGRITIHGEGVRNGWD